jgi:hypothetical protein
MTCIDWGNFILTQFSPSALNTAYGYAMSARNYALALLDVVTQSQPSLGTVAVLLIILLISMKIFNYLVNAVLFWVYLFAKIVFYGSLILVGFYVYQRGPEGALKDMNAFVNRWNGEYEKHKQKVEYTTAFYNQVGRGAPGGRAAREGQWWA